MPTSGWKRLAVRKKGSEHASDPFLRRLDLLETVLRIVSATGVVLALALLAVPGMTAHGIPVIMVVAVVDAGAWVLLRIDGAGWSYWLPAVRIPRRRLCPISENEKMVIPWRLVWGRFEGTGPRLQGPFRVALTNQRFLVRAPFSIPQLCLLDVRRRAIHRVETQSLDAAGRSHIRIEWQAETTGTFSVYPGRFQNEWIRAFAAGGALISLPSTHQ